MLILQFEVYSPVVSFSRYRQGIALPVPAEAEWINAPLIGSFAARRDRDRPEFDSQDGLAARHGAAR